MSLQQVSILLIEDDEDDAFLIKDYLSDIHNFEIKLDWEPDYNKGKEKIMNGSFDLFLIDFYLGKETGLNLIDFIQKQGVFTPAILLTGRNDSQIDIDASTAGAFDYLVKGDLTSDILERSIRYSIRQGETIRELDEKEKRYRSLFERSFDSIFLANIRLEFLEQNESFLNLFGFQEGELKRFELQKLFADSDDYDFCLSQLKENGVIKDFEVRLVTKLGEEKICLFNCIFIPDQEDENCCYQGIIRDLTLSKKAEADMMMAEKLSMTGKLARTIAHEIRNPLTNLNLALDSLQDEMNHSDESLSTYTQIIQRSSNRIESLIGDLLSSSKPKELQLELVSLDSIVQQVMTLVQDRAKLKDIRIEQSLEKGLPRLYVDTEKLSIALVNIFINGIEAIEHSDGLLQVSVSSRQNSIFLRIADNGGGIAKEDLKKIFDPFFTQKSNGTGLGLTSTLNILSSHNALIEVKSTVGEGTVFEIEFPLPEM